MTTIVVIWVEISRRAFDAPTLATSPFIFLDQPLQSVYSTPYRRWEVYVG